MTGFRIVLRKYGATPKAAFSGQSGLLTDGRWHNAGRALDYAADSMSLATLERLVHYKRFGPLEPHVLYTIELPKGQVEVIVTPPVGWNSKSPDAAQAVGNAWYDGGRTPALMVPSVVSAGEYNLLINSSHPNWNWKWVSRGIPFRFDSRIVTLLKGRR